MQQFETVQGLFTTRKPESKYKTNSRIKTDFTTRRAAEDSSLAVAFFFFPSCQIHATAQQSRLYQYPHEQVGNQQSIGMLVPISKPRLFLFPSLLRFLICVEQNFWNNQNRTAACIFIILMHPFSHTIWLHLFRKTLSDQIKSDQMKNLGLAQ